MKTTTMTSRSKLSRLTLTALGYLDMGWSVVPCHIPIGDGCSCGKICSWPGKHPRVQWRPYQERRPTESEVVEWFEEVYYGSNIGIVTGAVSKLVVVDVDGGDFKALKMPSNTLTAATGGGGQHYYYHCEGGVPTHGKLREKIDLKAEGGFVVAPPSVHKSGGRYEWTRKIRPLARTPDQFPEVIRDAMSAVGSSGNELQWYNTVLAGVEEGNRSFAAAKLAGRYATLGLTMDETLLLMEGWNTRNDPPAPDRELYATIQSVYRRHDARGKTVETLATVGELLTIVRRISEA